MPKKEWLNLPDELFSFSIQVSDCLIAETMLARDGEQVRIIRYALALRRWHLPLCRGLGGDGCMIKGRRHFINSSIRLF